MAISRAEQILNSMIDGTPYDQYPQSRLEDLLLQLKEVIEEGGGGGSSTSWGTTTFVESSGLEVVGTEYTVNFDGLLNLYVSPTTSKSEVYLTVEKKGTSFRYGTCWSQSGYYVSVLIPVSKGDVIKTLNSLNVSKVSLSTYPFA